MKKGDKYYCSFCGKSADEVRYIVAGPEPHDICNECIDVCIEIIYDQGGSLSTVNEKLGRKAVDLAAALGIKPRFTKVNIKQVEG